MLVRYLCLPLGLLLYPACRGWHEPMLVEGGPLHGLERATVVLAQAPLGYRAGNASIVRSRSGLWVAWEHATFDKTDTTLRLFHSIDGPFQDPWSSVVVKQTDGQTKPSLASSPEGIYLLSNHCGGTCGSVDVSHGRVEHYLVEAPLTPSSSWSFALSESRDAGRGDVASSIDPVTREPVPGQHLVACYSDTPAADTAGAPVEVLRCDSLGEKGWRNRFVLESGLNADHPSVLLDPGDRLLVGFGGRVDGRREALLRFDDETVLRLAPGVVGGDVQLARGGGSLHAVWRTNADGLWSLQLGSCATYPDCTTLDRWEVEEVSQAGLIDGLAVEVEQGEVVLSWSEGGSVDTSRVEMAWVCPDGLQRQRVADLASTNQGQPSMVLHDREIVLAYTALETEQNPAELRLARVRRNCK